MAFIDKRTKDLTPGEIKQFISDHIPYRIKILETVISYPNKVNTDRYWPSVYESAQITCRMFIQFLGMGISNQNKIELKEYRKYFSKDGKNSYEVKIKDLGFEFLNLTDLKPDEINALAHAYEAGNRATAHLTYESGFMAEPNTVIRSAILLKNILENKLKAMTRR